ncbi:MAG TPA: hypothetical protein VKE22_00300 [Haliangiales bacterium]|nr:hypothetical protein [Haliangiales bacterium]
MRPAIPRALARRIDRAARAAHRFHRFAHHPLCDEYAGEVVRIGAKGRVCRGCLAVIAGAALGLGAGWLVTPVVAAAALVVAVALVALSFVRRAGPRAPKWRTRLVPAAGLAAALASAVHAATAAGLALAVAALAAGAALHAAYRRRGPDRTPCAACPERLGPGPCRGFAEIVRRERAFRRLAGRWLTPVQ